MDTFFSKYKSEIFLTVLILYVLTLALGVIGELFDIEWILKLWIFNRTPSSSVITCNIPSLSLFLLSLGLRRLGFFCIKTCIN